MATPKPTQTKHDDSVPFYDGSYYLLATRLVDAVRRETGIANKLKGATREARAIGSHTRRRFSALGLIGKLLTAALLVGLGAGVAAGAYFYLLRPNPSALREDVRAHLALGQLVEARRDLEALRVAVGDLSPKDRAELAEPLRARLDSQARLLRREVGNARGHPERALAALDKLDALDADPRWALFTRAEVLRAGKLPGANAAYARFVELYPDSDQADDALFWQALIARDDGRSGDARALCTALLTRYPRSNFRKASERMLAELGEPAK
jgi:tetratricopeptide (TPR) repeat protein